MSTAPPQPKPPFVPTLGAVLVSAWPAGAVLTLGLELSAGNLAPQLLAGALALAVWTWALPMVVRLLGPYRLSGPTAVGVLVGALCGLVLLAAAGAAAGSVGETTAAAAVPLIAAGLVRRHADLEEAPRPCGPT